MLALHLSGVLDSLSAPVCSLVYINTPVYLVFLAKTCSVADQNWQVFTPLKLYSHFEYRDWQRKINLNVLLLLSEEIYLYIYVFF